MQQLAGLFALECWPIWVGFVFLYVVALVYRVTDRVPNALTLTSIAAAWIVAILGAVPGILPPMGGNFISSLICTGACFMPLLKAREIGLGAGCLKAQMAFSAWIGCGLPLAPAIVVGYFATLIGGATLAVVMLVSARFNIWRLDQISIGDDDAPGRQVPAQIPLAFGSIGGVMLGFILGAQFMPGFPPIQWPPAAAAVVQGGIN